MIELARTSISPERPETKLRRPSYLPPPYEGISESDLYDDTAEDFPGYDWFPGIGKGRGWIDRDSITWEDHGVCRNFLVGPCPAQLFQNTSVRVGECSKVHNFALQQSFRQSPRYSEYAPKFKDELARQCKKLISIADEKLQKQQSVNRPLCAVCALVVDDPAHAKRHEHVGYLSLREFLHKYERGIRKRYESGARSSAPCSGHSDAIIGDFEMPLKRSTESTPMPVVSHTPPPPVASTQLIESATAAPPASLRKSSSAKINRFSDAPVEKSAKLAALEASGATGYLLVSSTLVGSFRKGRTLKGGNKQPPICEEGHLIEEGQVDQLGTELPMKSNVSGEVLKILVDEGEAIDYGDPVIAVLPSCHGIR